MRHFFALIMVLCTTALFAGNIITYTATEKLPECSSYGCDGIRINAFNVPIQSHTFKQDSGTIVFAGELSRIDGFAFHKCSSLVSITIPEGVMSIGHWAFYGCNELTHISLPVYMKVIEEQAFTSCFKLQSITIPYGVEYIGKGTFCLCTSLQSAIIPNTVTAIGKEAFFLCRSLTSVVMPSSVNKIGAKAFTDCHKQLVVQVPNSDIQRYSKMSAFKKYAVVGYNSTNDVGAHDISISGNAPAILTYVDKSLHLIESAPNNAIDGNEQCAIQLQVTNTGKSTALGCVAKISAIGSIDGLQFSNINIPPIPTGQTCMVEIPILANNNTINGQVTFTIEVSEPRGYGTSPIQLTVETKAFRAPMLKIVDYTINGGNSNVVQKKVPFELRVLLQNIQKGEARNVTMQVSVPQGVNVLDGAETMSFDKMDGGEQQTADFQFIISNNFREPTLPITITLKESLGKYAESRTIALQIDQQTGSDANVTLTSTNATTDGSVSIGSLARGGSSAFGAPVVMATNATMLQSVNITTTFGLVPNSSVLTTFHNEFASLEMPDRDDSFPFALFRVRLKGNGNQVRLAKQNIMLNLGQLFQTEKTVTSYDNQILFLVPIGVRNVYLTCGDGCSQQQIFSGRLESNRIYDGVVEVK